MNRQTILTQEGVKRVTEELEHVKNVKFPQAIKRVIQAKEYGDPVELKDAKEEQAFYKLRVNYLTNMLETAKII